MKRAEANRRKRGRLLFKVSSHICRLSTSWDCGELARLTLEQLEFINHRLLLPCYLAACPGSGKTEVVGIKAAYEFSTWSNRYSGIAILTFTKNAADEISDRVIKYGGIDASRHPHFIGTFDSWLHSYIFQPFGHSFVEYSGRSGDKKISVIDGDSRAGFLQGFMTQGQSAARPVFANQFSYNAEGILETSEEELVAIIDDPQNVAELERCKKKFWKSGFATYQDAEFISYKILTTQKYISKCIAARFPVIIVDECQDLSPAQLKLLEHLQSEGVAIHLVGDLDQSIYEFRKSDPVLVNEYCKQHKLIEKGLTNNFRSNQNIVDVCLRLIGKEGATGTGNGIFSPACLLYEYSDLTSADLPSRFRELIDARGLNPSKCAILARGRSTLAKIAPQIDVTRKPVELFAAALNSYYGTSRKTDDLTNALEQIGKSIAYLAFAGKGNRLQQHCPDEMDDPVQWRMFLWDLLQRSSSLFPFENNGVKLTWSAWVGKLKQFLREEWATLPGSPIAWDAAETRIRASSGTANEEVSATLIERQRFPRVRTTTIHEAKGETLDAVLLVSSPDRRSKGGHFEHWIRPAAGNEEHQRFAYVACSRPKHLLIIAARKMKAKDRQELIDLGFALTADLVNAISDSAGDPGGDSIPCPTTPESDFYVATLFGD